MMVRKLTVINKRTRWRVQRPSSTSYIINSRFIRISFGRGNIITKVSSSSLSKTLFPKGHSAFGPLATSNAPRKLGGSYRRSTVNKRPKRPAENWTSNLFGDATLETASELGTERIHIRPRWGSIGSVSAWELIIWGGPFTPDWPFIERDRPPHPNLEIHTSLWAHRF